MRLLISAVIIGIISTSPACAKEQFGRFAEFIDRGSLKPFTRDLGGLLGSATFHNGRGLGITGFDIGAHGGIQLRPSKGNEVLRRSGVRTIYLPWVQAEIGLPFRIDGYIRGISFQGLTIAGGGLRYGISKDVDKPYKPQFLLSTVAHSVVHNDFTASHVGVNAVCSFGVPAFTPYLGAGFDRTRVVVKSATGDPTMVGVSATTFESRFTAGMSWRPWTFVYIQTAYTLAHRESGFDTGLGVRF